MSFKKTNNIKPFEKKKWLRSFFRSLLWQNCILIVAFLNGLVYVLADANQFTRILLYVQTHQLRMVYIFEVMLFVCNYCVKKKLDFAYILYRQNKKLRLSILKEFT